MELDFDKYCLVDRSPTTVLPHPRCRTKVADRKSNEKPKFEKNIETSPSGSCVDVRSERFKNEVLKRGSVYHNSKEASLFRSTDDFVERKKIELSIGNVPALSFEIIDSLCSSDEDSAIAEQNRTRIMISTELATAPTNDANSPREKEMPVDLQRSLSARLPSPHSPAKSSESSPKSRFSPVKKMFDPFIKSKSRRSPLSSSNHDTKSIPKSLLSNLSDKPRFLDYKIHCEEKENRNLGPQSSPAHLHGFLKMGKNRRGVRFFEFSVKSPEDFYVAKTRKLENASNQVYTFHHSLHKRSHDGWRVKESNRESSMVGQMHVSCAEFKNGGELNDSVVTEFVMYDTIHPRKGISDQMLSWGNCEHNEISAKKMINKDQVKRSRESVHFKSSSASRPLPAAELHPELEIAAIIMQVPFQKDGISDNSSPVKMHVVVPAGNHGLPISEGNGPSRLVDRWRLGGGCDCGGWDMACPLTVFSNSKISNVNIVDLMDNRNHAELFVQGKKDNLPAFTMRGIGDGKYAVDFHARLSSLQAFSICVAILHAAVVGRIMSNQVSQLDSYAKEGIENMMDAIEEEEEERGTPVNKTEQAVLPSFVLSPPFSPIARV